MQSIISGTGSYIPKIKMKNEDFLSKEFFNESQNKLPNSNEVVIKKFKAITGIEERRYLTDDLKNSDIATIAALAVSIYMLVLLFSPRGNKASLSRFLIH